MKAILVSIFTGFLGSGKTTLINHILKGKEQSIFVIVNEFGDINIDSELFDIVSESEIYSYNNNCFCCVGSNELVSIFAKIITLIDSKKVPIEKVVIELSGLADPGPVIKTILQTPYMSDYFMIDSVYCLIDANNFCNQLDQYPEVQSQLAYADRVLLTKHSQTTDLSHLIYTIGQINPYIDIISLDYKQKNQPSLLGKGLFNRSFERAFLEDGNHVDNGIICHQHSDLQSFSIVLDEPLPAIEVEAWLENLIRIYGDRLVRYKGIVNVAGFENILIIQGVGKWFQLDRGPNPSKQKMKTSIVLIGHDLPQDDIKQMLISQK